jgi:hypothetical protein
MWVIITACNKKFDCLLGISLTSSLSILLCKSDHEFIVKNKIDPDATKITMKIGTTAIIFTEYSCGSEKKIGKIKGIFTFQNSMFCIIVKYNTKRIAFHELDNKKNYIDRFFRLVESNEVIEVVCLEKII